MAKLALTLILIALLILPALATIRIILRRRKK